MRETAPLLACNPRHDLETTFAVSLDDGRFALGKLGVRPGDGLELMTVPDDCVVRTGRRGLCNETAQPRIIRLAQSAPANIRLGSGPAEDEARRLHRAAERSRQDLVDGNVQPAHRGADAAGLFAAALREIALMRAVVIGWSAGFVRIGFGRCMPEIDRVTAGTQRLQHVSRRVRTGFHSEPADGNRCGKQSSVNGVSEFHGRPPVTDISGGLQVRGLVVPKQAPGRLRLKTLAPPTAESAADLLPAAPDRPNPQSASCLRAPRSGLS